MSQLLVITGPIASGKSTIASGLARRLVEEGASVAVVDLDEVVGMVVAPLDQFDEWWLAARRAHGELVASWLRAGVDVVIAHGPIYTSEDDGLLLGCENAARRVLLRVPYDEACVRVAADPTRGASRDLEFLRVTHERFAALLPEMAACDWEFDTSMTSPESIIDILWHALE